MGRGTNSRRTEPFHWVIRVDRSAYWSQPSPASEHKLRPISSPKRRQQLRDLLRPPQAEPRVVHFELQNRRDFPGQGCLLRRTSR